MNTRDKILDTARKLFNEKGLRNVTARSICGNLQISLGSFSYYFPDKDQIVTDLYQMMLTDMQTVIAAIPRDNVSITFFLELHKQMFNIQNTYKFFYLNLFEILNNNEEIRKIYAKNAELEKKMAHELLELYVDKGILKKGIKTSQFERLIHVGQMLNNSWAIDAEINFKGNQKKQLAHYMNVCCGLLEPYLTEPALHEYHTYFDKLGS